MKRILMGFLVFFLCYFSFAYASSQVETYKIDPQHTYVLWYTTHVGFSTQSGKFVLVDGTITLNEVTPENSKLNVTIKTANIVTGIPKLDHHLKGKDFFNVEKYPTATFVSDKIEVTGKETGKIYGKLTLLGVTKPVVLDVKLIKAGMHPLVEKKSLGFSATGNIKRSDFGMKYLVGPIGDEVKLEIGAEANLMATPGAN
jgi:polyisoprenoid-binding protein YceI